MVLHSKPRVPVGQRGTVERSWGKFRARSQQLGSGAACGHRWKSVQAEGLGSTVLIPQLLKCHEAGMVFWHMRNFSPNFLHKMNVPNSTDPSLVIEARLGEPLT